MLLLATTALVLPVSAQDLCTQKTCPDGPPEIIVVTGQPSASVVEEDGVVSMEFTKAGKTVGFVLLEQDGIHMEVGDTLVSVQRSDEDSSIAQWAIETDDPDDRFVAHLASEDDGEKVSIAISDHASSWSYGSAAKNGSDWDSFYVAGFEAFVFADGSVALASAGSRGRNLTVPELTDTVWTSHVWNETHPLPDGIDLVMPGDHVTLTRVDNSGAFEITFDGLSADEATEDHPDWTITSGGAYGD